MQIDSVVMMSGLIGLGLILTGTVGHGMDVLSSNVHGNARVAVLDSGFDASACPKGWIKAHADNTGLTPQDIASWYAQKSRAVSDATVLAALDAHAQAPKDFRFRAPMRLAELQILMCLAENRGLQP